MNKFEQECEAITEAEYEGLAHELRSWAADAHLADRGQAILMAKAAIVIERLTRPDDIPASAWERAGHAIDDLDDLVDFSNDGRIRAADMDRQYDAVQSVISNAILAAVQEEREGCAALCDADAKKRRANADECMSGSWQWGVPEFATMAQLHKSVTATNLATAIRNRSVTEGE